MRLLRLSCRAPERRLTTFEQAIASGSAPPELVRLGGKNPFAPLCRDGSGSRCAQNPLHRGSTVRDHRRGGIWGGERPDRGRTPSAGGRMRLSNVARGDRLSSRLLYAFVRAVSGFRAPDVVRTLRYRPHLFGRPHSAHTHAVMRGPSEWSVGERELFAAFVSRMNQCHF